MKTDEKVIGILADIACKPIDGITGDTRLNEDLELESLDRVEAASMLEAEFGIQIEDDEATNAVTVGDVVRLVGAKAAATGAC